MNRTRIVLAIGIVVVIFGSFLGLMADSLATNWQPNQTGNGWGGVTDPAMRQTYRVFGLTTFCFGFIFITIAASVWMTENQRALRRSSTE